MPKTSPVAKPIRAKKTTPIVSRAVKHRAVAARPVASGAGGAEKREYIQTVGRRKSAIARLRFYSRGKGSITINTKDYRQYFPYIFWQETVTEALPLVGMNAVADIIVKVNGGGLQAQAEAVRLALARALILHNPDWRPTLRKMGWLTRDPREKERKKPGLKRARRGPQWAKR